MSNVAEHLEQHLRPAQLDLLRRASRVSAELGVELFLVGGTVRDILSRTHPTDVDLVEASGTPGFASELASRLAGEVLASSQFGTSKLGIGETRVDLAAARRETYAHPGALPDVATGNIDEDLARRDFSINAMAVSLSEGAFGALLDPFEGRRDLDRGLIRVLHSNSFVDDATRILRAVRYASRLGFRLEGETESLLTRDLGYLDAIGGDRVRHELVRMFREPRAVETLRAAQDLGVLTVIHPDLRIESAVLAKMRSVPIEPTGENDLRFLALLVFSVPASALPQLVGRLNMDSRWATVVRDVASVRDAFRRLGEEKVRSSQVYGMLRRLDVTSIEGCAIATDEPLVKERLELYLAELRHVKPLLNGNDLIALGVPEGPQVGRLLEELLTARLEGLLVTREDEEYMVVRSLGETDPARS